MLLSPKAGRDLKRTYKRIAIFLVGVFLIDAFICFILYSYTGLIDYPVVCGIIIVAITTILYLLFSLLCAKIDKKREEKREKSTKRDPFSHN